MPKSSPGISLLPQDVQQTKASQEKKRKLRLISLLVLGIFVLSSAASVGVSLYLKGISSSLTSSISQKEKEISSLGEVEELIKSFSYRLSSISDIFSQRKYYSRLIRTLNDISPERVVLSEITVDGNDVRVSGTALDYFSLAEFISNSSAEGSGGMVFSKAELSGVSLEKRTGGIRFSAVLSIKEGGLSYAR